MRFLTVLKGVQVKAFIQIVNFSFHRRTKSTLYQNKYSEKKYKKANEGAILNQYPYRNPEGKITYFLLFRYLILKNELKT